MSATPETILCSISVERAKAIMREAPIGTERYALANSIVSLSAANENLGRLCDEYELKLKGERR
jgi:hypothetical protein